MAAKPSLVIKPLTLWVAVLILTNLLFTLTTNNEFGTKCKRRWGKELRSGSPIESLQQMVEKNGFSNRAFEFPLEPTRGCYKGSSLTSRGGSVIPMDTRLTMRALSPTS